MSKMVVVESMVLTNITWGTSLSVLTSLNEAKFANKVTPATNVNTKPRDELFFEYTMHQYMEKVDSALFMISSILHLVKSGKASEISEVHAGEAFDATIKVEAVTDSLAKVEESPVREKSAEDMFEARTDDNVANASGETTV